MWKSPGLRTLLIVAAMSGGALAQEVACDSCDMSPPQKSGFASCLECDEFWTQPRMTGDWGGLRSGLEESGVTFSGRSTQFGFGMNGGIKGPGIGPLKPADPFSYTGRGEYDAKFDLEKFGGLPHGSLLVRMEHWYGQYGNVSLSTGAIPPAVFPASIPPAPNDPGELFMTNFLVTQPLSEKLVLFGGKKDVLGAADQDVFAGGDGTDQFMNQAFVANPAFLLGLPYTGVMAGAAMPQEWGMVSAIVFDPKDRTQDFFDLGDLFSKGVIVGGEIKVNTNLFNRKGEVHGGGMWKHVDLTDLRFNEPPPGQYPEQPVPGFPTLPNSWTLYTGFDQFLFQFGEKQSKGWGLFGRASISDANPTPLRYFLSMGLGGDSELRRGKGDRWGAGWYYIGASDKFGPIPQFIFGPQDGTGVELYYNVQVTPWMNVTPDLQYIRPDAGAIANDSFIYGVRVNMTL